MRATFDPDDLGWRFYQLMTAVVVPRPIAWVSTVSAAGVDNLAPHSFFTVGCVNPPIVQFTSVGRKDSLRNVEATSEFVVNLAPESLFEQVNATGVQREPSLRVRPPRVADSPVALECVLHSTLRLGDSTIVFGRVVLAAIREDVLVDGHPEVGRLRPLSRLGRDEWGAAADVRSIPRISYRDWPGHYEAPAVADDPTD
jgi:flavin reductase (DIM6/NTAB) family NADH-FMN oxidoreductase RutF